MLKKTLDNGTKLMIVDDLAPEDEAMLQALYSRSAESAEVHLDKVKQADSGKFMNSYYVGYGHKSIADCGTTTMFIEGVSLLAAKAIQDWPLYSGQETSTRYIDMSKQRIVDPVGTPESKAILDAWMSFYKGNQTRVAQTLVKRYPMRDGEKEEMYQRAIKARTFDILRGFLPAGITTQLSWHTNLRQAGDHLIGLVQHPATEIREMAHALREMLGSSYPSSGAGLSLAAVSGVDNKDQEARDARLVWERRVATEFTYPVESSLTASITVGRVNGRSIELLVGARNLGIRRYAEILATRPKGCMLPHFMTDLGQYSFEFLLDFGSFRDLQRHRNGVVRMPLLDTNWGFEHWYLQQLGDPNNEDVGGLRDEAVELIHVQQARIRALPGNSVERQYYTALGFQVPCQVMFGLPSLLYFLELRSGKTVHPTLRKQVHTMIKIFQKNHPDDQIALHVDMDPDDWDVRRGDQTITEKK
jgi:thymidylate synthase ThyX